MPAEPCPMDCPCHKATDCPGLLWDKDDGGPPVKPHTHIFPGDHPCPWGMVRELEAELATQCDVADTAMEQHRAMVAELAKERKRATEDGEVRDLIRSNSAQYKAEFNEDETSLVCLRRLLGFVELRIPNLIARAEAAEAREARLLANLSHIVNHCEQVTISPKALCGAITEARAMRKDR